MNQRVLLMIYFASGWCASQLAVVSFDKSARAVYIRIK